MTYKAMAAVIALAVAALGDGAAWAGDPIAEAFGAREGVEQAALSPDGSKVAFLVPTAGQGSTLFTVSTEAGAEPRPALAVSGAPDRLAGCHWVSNDRLVCTFWGNAKSPDVRLPLSYSRLVAVDVTGQNQKVLTTREMNWGAVQFFGGSVIDWLPGAHGEVLLARSHGGLERDRT